MPKDDKIRPVPAHRALILLLGLAAINHPEEAATAKALQDELDKQFDAILAEQMRRDSDFLPSRESTAVHADPVQEAAANIPIP